MWLHTAQRVQRRNVAHLCELCCGGIVASKMGSTCSIVQFYCTHLRISAKIVQGLHKTFVQKFSIALPHSTLWATCSLEIISALLSVLAVCCSCNGCCEMLFFLTHLPAATTGKSIIVSVYCNILVFCSGIYTIC